MEKRRKISTSTFMQTIFIDHTWTLFLDRDGVINKNIDGGYVLSPDQFEFLPGVLDCLPKLSKMFGKIIVVSNQQCVGKGLITEEELREIHQDMMNVIELNGGRIDAVYYAPGLASPDNTLRKPANGMALLAKSDFPEIDFKKAIMAGDKLSDMEFGRSLNMTTFYLSGTYTDSPLVDQQIQNLPDLLNYVKIKA